MSVVAAHRAMTSPGYEEIRVRRGRRSGVTMAIAIHRTVAGRALGGLRMYPYESEDAAIADVERLARAMTFKAAAAGLKLGGAKAVIALAPGAPPTGRRREDVLRDFAELVESLGGRYITAQDVGTSQQDIVFLSRFTEHLSGRPIPDGGAGDPSPYTAHGVEVGIRASVKAQLSGRQIVVIGLGHVGSQLARRLAGAGARLTVTDADPAKRALAEQLGAAWVAPEQALALPADVLAPCALGAILNEHSIPALQVPVVAGAANNQLADDALADALRDRGIVWAPDFVINAGGLIAVADELHGFNPGRVQDAIEQLADTLTEIYGRAAQRQTNTLTAAMQLAAQRLTGGADGNDS
ncbi:MAG: Glu/Leu/Phe/Val dehydrogenase dimerization domain-containing protein [Solirubrobacteraceae bacterium]